MWYATLYQIKGWADIWLAESFISIPPLPRSRCDGEIDALCPARHTPYSRATRLIWTNPRHSISVERPPLGLPGRRHGYDWMRGRMSMLRFPGKDSAWPERVDHTRALTDQCHRRVTAGVGRRAIYISSVQAARPGLVKPSWGLPPGQQPELQSAGPSQVPKGRVHRYKSRRGSIYAICMYMQSPSKEQYATK